jgi:hypothetical protein
VQSLACNFPWSFKVPTYTDLFEQNVKSTVVLGVASEFLSYDEVSNIIKADHPELLNNYKGKHQIRLVLTDKQKN